MARRRRLRLWLAILAGGFAALLVAAGLIWPFLVLKDVIELLPLFAAVSELILMLLIAAVLARALFPETKPLRTARA